MIKPLTGADQPAEGHGSRGDFFMDLGDVSDGEQLQIQMELTSCWVAWY